MSVAQEIITRLRTFADQLESQELLSVNFVEPGKPLASGGSRGFASWLRLQNHLEAACALREGEVLEGITVKPNGIQFHIHFE